MECWRTSDVAYHLGGNNSAGEWCSNKLTRKLPPAINSANNALMQLSAVRNCTFSHIKFRFSPALNRLWRNPDSTCSRAVASVRKFENELCVKCRCVPLSHENTICTCATRERTLNVDKWKFEFILRRCWELAGRLDDPGDGEQQRNGDDVGDKAWMLCFLKFNIFVFYFFVIF